MLNLSELCSELQFILTTLHDYHHWRFIWWAPIVITYRYYLVKNEGIGEHVTTGGGKKIHLLQHIKLQLVLVRRLQEHLDTVIYNPL